MGVSKNTGTPKWMVKIMENPIKMDDFGGIFPLFLECHPYNLVFWVSPCRNPFKKILALKPGACGVEE